MKEKKNTLGIIGICVGFFIPLVGVVLGISSARNEKSTAIGIMSIISLLIVWIIGWAILVFLFRFFDEI